MRNVSGLIHANISTSPLSASWVMTGTSPSALNWTAASCSSVAVDGHGRHRYSPVEASMRSAATACRSRSRSMM